MFQICCFLCISLSFLLFGRLFLALSTKNVVLNHASAMSSLQVFANTVCVLRLGFKAYFLRGTRLDTKYAYHDVVYTKLKHNIIQVCELLFTKVTLALKYTIIQVCELLFTKVTLALKYTIIKVCELLFTKVTPALKYTIKCKCNFSEQQFTYLYDSVLQCRCNFSEQQFTYFYDSVLQCKCNFSEQQFTYFYDSVLQCKCNFSEQQFTYLYDSVLLQVCELLFTKVTPALKYTHHTSMWLVHRCYFQRLHPAKNSYITIHNPDTLHCTV